MSGLGKGRLIAGKYCLLKSLGAGGEAGVWLAMHVQTEHLWAVKLFPAGYDVHEVNMLKKLHHEMLPEIVDVLETDTEICLVMEYVRGKNLEELFHESGPFSPEEIMKLGTEVCSVLSYLHTRKIPVYHLDVKPANLIRRKNGSLVLVDFGASWRDWKTGCHPGRGTVGFAAPEQYDRRRAVGAWTDLYSLGAALYYLVSGIPYSQSMKKSKIPGCPDKLGMIIKKCLQENPAERYSSAKQVSQELLRLRKSCIFRKKRCQFWLVLLFALFPLGMAERVISSEWKSVREEQWDYEKLVSEAACVQEKTAQEYYQRAVFLEPGRKDAYLAFLRRADADAVFSETEELFFRGLLHDIPPGEIRTYEEILGEDPEAYGEVADYLGIMYWYDYRGVGNRQYAAGWFQKAAEAAEKCPENEAAGGWKERCRIYEHMSGYYEALGLQTGHDLRGDILTDYWSDTGKLLGEHILDAYPYAELKFYDETLQQIIFLAERLHENGISVDDMREVLTEIAGKAEQTEPGENPQLSALRKQIVVERTEAEAVLQRIQTRNAESSNEETQADIGQ